MVVISCVDVVVVGGTTAGEAEVAAATAARSGSSPRNVNVRALQTHLVEVGNLPVDVLSHHRAVTLTLERPADPLAAKTPAALLNKPGMQGHTMTEVPRGTEKLEERTESLREIILARALYRCGDHQGLGREILQRYQDDFRGLFAGHAYHVLTEH